MTCPRWPFVDGGCSLWGCSLWGPCLGSRPPSISLSGLKTLKGTLVHKMFLHTQEATIHMYEHSWIPSRRQGGPGAGAPCYTCAAVPLPPQQPPSQSFLVFPDELPRTPCPTTLTSPTPPPHPRHTPATPPPHPRPAPATPLERWNFESTA